MSKILQFILDWSEVWALLIPLVVLIFTHKQPALLKPMIVYLWVALILNVFGDIIANLKSTLHFPEWLQSNNPVYNIHSIVRFSCFSYFFFTLKQPFFKTLRKVLAFILLVFIIIDFTFFERFFNRDHLSGDLLSAEAYLLLIYCMLFYLAQLKNKDDVMTSGPEFWIVTGLSVYVVVNFFVFLFYVPLLNQNYKVADEIWDVHNIAYIILCFFIAKAFYATNRN